MRSLRRTSLIGAAFLVLAACLLPTVNLADPSAQATSMAGTVVAAVRETQSAASPVASDQPPSLSPQPTFTATATFTPSPTQTVFTFSTVTPLVPFISVSVPTNCRTGPGKPYTISGALLIGKLAQVFARDPTGTYWYIPNPDSPGEFCWVWGEYATVTGLVETLPIFTPPPTPTPTVTPTPAPAFDLSYEELVSCSGDWWPRLRIKNTGLITFRSLSLIVRDTNNDTSTADLRDGFADRSDCSSSTSRTALPAGKATIIASSAFDHDLSGHKMRAVLTLCSDTGQEGTCITGTLTFKP
jgi:hypothetical protein